MPVTKICQLETVNNETALKLQNAGVGFRVMPPGTATSRTRCGVWLSFPPLTPNNDVNVWMPLTLSIGVTNSSSLVNTNFQFGTVNGFWAGLFWLYGATARTNWERISDPMTLTCVSRSNPTTRTWETFQTPANHIYLYSSAQNLYNFFVFEIIWSSPYNILAFEAKIGDDRTVSYLKCRAAFYRFVTTYGGGASTPYNTYYFRSSEYSFPDFINTYGQPLFFNLVHGGSVPVYVHEVLVVGMS